MKPDQNNLIRGIPLDFEQKLDLFFTMLAIIAYNHYSFGITQRLLTISPERIDIL
jgi:hypothetical protein